MALAIDGSEAVLAMVQGLGLYQAEQDRGSRKIDAYSI